MTRIVRNFGFMIATAAIIFTGCKDKDDTPNLITPTFSPDIVSVAEGSAATATINAGKEPFKVQSLDETVATATVEGKTITIAAVKIGTVNINVTGDDGGSAKLAVSVTQKDANAPTLSASTVEVEEDFEATVEITGGTPDFTVTSANPGIATATVSGTVITVKGIKGGTTLVNVAGSDGASVTFAVVVNDEQILFGPDKKQLGSGLKSFSLKKSHTIKKGTYTMVGWIYVEDGVTLTIEPGTVFKCSDVSFDGRTAATGTSLIIQKGGKIMAEGTREQPIVFTSAKPKGQRQATDWGGIIICGKARNNQGTMTIEGGVEADHGGNDDDDNSGVMRYCRLEFGGYPYALDNEINGLTLGSVGRGTTLEYIQVSYSGDDSYEWFGGSVNCKHLIAYHGWDDDFDTDNGFSGKLQFLLGVRDPKIADQSNSNGFESDNNANGGTELPYTTCVFSNVTIIGPIGQDPNFNNYDVLYPSPASAPYITGYNWGNSTDAAFPIRTGIFQCGMQVRRNSRLSCFNSVFTGYPVGIMLSNDGRGDTQGAAINDLLKVKNVYFAGMGRVGSTKDNKLNNWIDAFDVNSGAVTSSETYFLQSGLNNKVYATIDELKLKDIKSKELPLVVNTNGGKESARDSKNANWGPMTGSPLLNAAGFTDPFLSDSFFERVTYIGAFASDSDADNWTKGWTNFDPQNTDY
jgi:hypothetical protein